jgi:two-component system response regulator YesN
MGGAAEAPAAGLHRARRVLIVDDEEAIRRSLAIYFRRRLGYEVAEAGTLEAAVAAAAAGPLDLCVMDIRLGGDHGLEALARLRQIHLRLPTIIFTGSTHFSWSPDLARLGLSRDQLLHKPLEDLAVIGRLAARLVGDPAP